MATGFIIVGGVFTAATFFFLIRAAWTDKSIGGWLVLAVVAAAMAGIVFWLGMEESYAGSTKGHGKYDGRSSKTIYRYESPRYCNRDGYEETVEIDAAYYGHGYDNDYDFWYLPYLP